MYLLNTHPEHGLPLDEADARLLGRAGAEAALDWLAQRGTVQETPLHALPGLAGDLGVGALHVKDEGFRLGLGSFKALGGAYAVARLVAEEAERVLGRPVGLGEIRSPEVAAVAAGMTVACATDGNHGRSVAQGAQLVGARAAIFVHAGVSAERVAAIARYGAEMIRVEGTYDDSVAASARVSAERGWTVVSDTTWPGYERIPGIVMQGYTVLAHEALARMPEPPTHVFLQAGVGGFAAAVAAHLVLALGDRRPKVVVVEPARAACVFGSAMAGHQVTIPHGEPTVMAMLECYVPSLVAWRILSRIADAFMTVEEQAAVDVMNRLARPSKGDPAVVAGESGGAGLAGAIAAASDPSFREALGLGPSSRILVVNTEGATDPALYTQFVGLTPEAVLGRIAV